MLIDGVVWKHMCIYTHTCAYVYTKSIVCPAEPTVECYVRTEGMLLN